MKKNNLNEKINHVSIVKSVLKVFIPVILMLLTGLSSLTAQIKIFIETDLEGVSGVYNFTQTREKGSPDILAFRLSS